MAALDGLLLLVLLLSCLIGMWRGLVYEALVMTGWIVAFFVARLAAQAVGQHLPLGHDVSPALRAGLGGVVVFIVVAFACGWIASRLRHVVRVMGLRPIDGLLGAVFGAARAIAVLLVVVALVNLTSMAQAPWWRASVGVQWLQALLQQLQAYLPPQASRYVYVAA